MIYREFIEAGYKIFGLHGATKKQCNCGREDCSALFKHPVASNWQHTPHWSDDQLEVMEEMGQLATGYGVLVSGLLVVDVDARNGGVKSYEKLLEDVPELIGAGLIVNTGSGKGSKHLYFKSPVLAMVQTHADYPGIDFKSSGFVVGPGSMHYSGKKYEVGVGSPDEINDAPQALLDILAKPEKHRAEYNGQQIDVSDDEIAVMLKAIKNDDLDYEVFIRIGMAIHSATGGSSFDLWDNWASESAKYDPREMDYKWQSFGKSSNPVTLGTLMHYAEEGGYTESVEFVSEIIWERDEDEPIAPSKDDRLGLPFPVEGVDLLRPPGFVGEVCAWVNSQSMYPRESLAVGATIYAMGNVCGLRYIDDLSGVTANLFVFCVADSGTGKNSIEESVQAIHTAAGIQRAQHGGIKSEQEIIRNLIHNQAAFMVIDEFGLLLQKINNARKNGGAAYLDSVVAVLMSAYSKAKNFMLLNGDTKEDVRKALKGELSQCRKLVSENDDDNGHAARRIPNLERALSNIDSGLERPFLSLIGMTTPTTFDTLVTREQATNGFIGRALLIRQKDENPKGEYDFNPPDMSFGMGATIAGLYNGGAFDSNEAGRVEYYSERIKMQTDSKAKEMMRDAFSWFWRYAEIQKDTNGLTAIVRRGYEMVSKISLILAAPEGVRTPEHVRWAFAMVRHDLDTKIAEVMKNDEGEEKMKPQDELRLRIIGRIDEKGQTMSHFVNRIKKFKRSEIESTVQAMLDDGTLYESETKASNGRKSTKFFLTEGQ